MKRHTQRKSVCEREGGRERERQRERQREREGGRERGRERKREVLFLYILFVTVNMFQFTRLCKLYEMNFSRKKKGLPSRTS